MRQIIINILLLAGIIAGLCIALKSPAQTIHYGAIFNSNGVNTLTTTRHNDTLTINPDTIKVIKIGDRLINTNNYTPPKCEYKGKMFGDHLWVEKIQDAADTIHTETSYFGNSDLVMSYPPEHEYRVNRVMVCIKCWKEKTQILHTHNKNRGNPFQVGGTGGTIYLDEPFDPVIEHSEIKSK